MRVCIEKSTGRLIESQSGGETQEHLDTLLNNAVNTGYPKEDVEVKFMDGAEYQTLLELSKPEPTKEQLYEALIKAKEAEILRRQAIAELEAEK